MAEQNWESNVKELHKALEITDGKPADYFVVYVDDEPDLHTIFTEQVAKFGLKCFATTSVHEAMNYIGAHTNKVVSIVSDFKMPDTDGFEFRQLALGKFPQIPFAILSAFINREMALKGVELKISAFIDKPANMAKIADLMAGDVLVRIKTIKEEKEFLEAFLEDATNNLESVEEMILKLEQDPGDMDNINRFFGLVHTVKGGSSFFEPKTLNHFAHAFEEIIKSIQKGNLYVNGDVVSGILSAVDFLKKLLGEFHTGEHKSYDIESITKEMFTFDTTKRGQKSETVEESEGAIAARRAAKDEKQEIKVAVSILDEFMQISGEMTVIRNMLNKCVRAIEKRYFGDKDVAQLVVLLDELHKINGSVQSKITELRKVPMRNVLKAMPRAIRDVSKQVGKEAEYISIGEEMRVDTSIAEVLSNCLVHVIRNSMDHGIESPADRKAAGKNPKGKVQISSSTQNDHVIVEIEDDGRGINPEKIKQKLLSNGSHTKEQIARMPQQELFGMIFEAGFSTAEKVTDISGRGVGMSMVKSSIEGVGGRIEIVSHVGQGTKFIFKMPVPKSVLITNCLFVREEHMQFGVPQDQVLRVMKFDDQSSRKMIGQLEGASALHFGDELVPIVSLKKILGFPVQGEDLDWEKHKIVVIHYGDKKLALKVEEVLDVEDTVIKPLQGSVKNIGLYMGATFLGDSSVALILNGENVIQRVGIHRKSKSAYKETDEEIADAASRSSMLLFKVGEKGLFVMPQGEVYRIENFAGDSIAHSGRANVIPYRDRVVTLLDVENLLFTENQPLERFGGTLSTVIVKSDKNFLGLVVSKVLDITEAVGEVIPPARKEPGILGNFIIGKETVTAVDIPYLIEIARNTVPKPSESSEAA